MLAVKFLSHNFHHNSIIFIKMASEEVTKALRYNQRLKKEILKLEEKIIRQESEEIKRKLKIEELESDVQNSKEALAKLKGYKLRSG